MTFDEAFTKLLGHEGSFSDHPADKGGPTMWGVTEAVARAHGYQGDMQQFPQQRAKDIYREQYWHALRCTDLPPDVRFTVFDAAVNSGPTQAAKWLQRAVQVTDDGEVGPVTLAAAQRLPASVITSRLSGHRLQFMTGLANWPSFGSGWANRIAKNLMDD